MRHVAFISRRPALAAETTPTDSNLCGTIGSNFQAQLCFVLTFLLQFILPLSQAVLGTKGDQDTDTTGA